jgi:hypothetical protein
VIKAMLAKNYGMDVLAPLLNPLLLLNFGQNETTRDMDKEEMLRHLEDLLLSLAGLFCESPVIMVIDDAHFMDQYSWSLIGCVFYCFCIDLMFSLVLFYPHCAVLFISYAFPGFPSAFSPFLIKFPLRIHPNSQTPRNRPTPHHPRHPPHHKIQPPSPDQNTTPTP